MLESLVRGALKQRLVVCVIAVVLLFFGLHAATKLSVDAFPARPDRASFTQQARLVAHHPRFH
jgi:Cu/Ag efflux pump CusA